jgi:hypothetical protein
VTKPIVEPAEWLVKGGGPEGVSRSGFPDLTFSSAAREPTPHGVRDRCGKISAAAARALDRDPDDEDSLRDFAGIGDTRQFDRLHHTKDGESIRLMERFRMG